MHDFEGEAPLTHRRDDQPAGRERCVRLVMAAAAEGDQAVEVESEPPRERLITWWTSRRLRRPHAWQRQAARLRTWL